jgi:hypothetical protein
MARRIERAMALLVVAISASPASGFAVGCASLGTQHSLHRAGWYTASVYRRHALRATAGLPPCVAKQATRSIRNREGRVTAPHLV